MKNIPGFIVKPREREKDRGIVGRRVRGKGNERSKEIKLCGMLSFI